MGSRHRAPLIHLTISRTVPKKSWSVPTGLARNDANDRWHSFDLWRRNERHSRSVVLGFIHIRRTQRGLHRCRRNNGRRCHQINGINGVSKTLIKKIGCIDREKRCAARHCSTNHKQRERNSHVGQTNQILSRTIRHPNSEGFQN